MGALDDWLTTQEAAQLAGYHPDYLRKLVKACEIQAQKWGNAWMVSRESVLQYMARVQTQGEKRGPKTAQ
jgi:excisionase family DNA binding protein